MYGLRFGLMFDVFRKKAYFCHPQGIHNRYWGGKIKLKVTKILQEFRSGSFQQKGDSLKMALVLFANNILFGQDERIGVTRWLLDLVEDLKSFNAFPWSHYVFKMTLYYIRRRFHVSMKYGTPLLKYNLLGSYRLW
ncbi:hypothetical protein Ddye_013152, partial [Dipteronia dyeriana]